MVVLLAVVALSSFYLGRKTNTEEVAPVATKPPVEVEIARVEKPIEVKEQVKDESQAVTLQYSGEAKRVDYSPEHVRLIRRPLGRRAMAVHRCFQTRTR